MARAYYNDTLLAESDKTEVVEGNHYFPPESVKQELFSASPTSTHCGWKGDASYYNLKLADEDVADAAWFYANPLPKAMHIKDYVAFYQRRGVRVED